MTEIKLKMTPSHFEELVNKGYSMDAVCLLKMVEQNIDVKTLCESSSKLRATYQMLVRKGLITNELNVTLEGKNILDFIDTPIQKTYEKKKPVDDDFERWWKTYPGTDTFTYKDKSFTGSRTLRVKKEECRIKFNKILQEGDYTVDLMIKALEQEVMQKKETSLKEKTNKLIYMQNSLTYLNQRTFEPFIELVNQNVKTVSGVIKDVDI